MSDLIEWSQMAANSDAFAQATVTEYWKLLIGHKPTPMELVNSIKYGGPSAMITNIA